MKNKKRKVALILLLLVLVLAAAGGGAFYYVQRQAAAKAVEHFLTGVQKMNFDTMESLLQSKDLTALDDADVRNHIYSDFFAEINQKMTYEITKNDFDLQNGTAQVTARIKYIDGSDVYKQTISEFLRQMVSSAFSGNSLTEEETQQKLASILDEQFQNTENKFAETEITYPVIKVNDQWKIVSLDDETVKIMSANFKSVEDEIQASLENMDAEPTPDTQPAAAEGDVIDMNGEKFTIQYTQFRVANDFAGKPCLMFYYNYTNNSDTASSAMVDLKLQAYQNGALLEATIPEENDAAVDAYMSEIQPGETKNICQVFSLPGTEDVTIQAEEAFDLGDGASTSQIVKVQ